MSNIEKISISLTKEMMAIVNDAVQSGAYASQSEVIREALRHWRPSRISPQNEAELQQIWNEGINSGTGKYGSFQKIKQAARTNAAGDNI